MVFEELPTTPRADELVDQAFSRAARSGRAKSGHEAQESMLRTAGNILSDNLENIVTVWPDFETIDPVHYELAEAVLQNAGLGGVDELRQHLSGLGWASRQIASIRDEYTGRLRGVDDTTSRKLRKQAFARYADIVDDIEDDLDVVGTARDALRDLPDIRPDEPTIVVAGYPNVGKSTFVNRVTSTGNDVAAYPFTTTQIQVGHVDRPVTSNGSGPSAGHGRVRYQLVDTPGLLDRPPSERNAIESQAVSALTHLADAVLVLVDASEGCGYPLEDQLTLRDTVVGQFDVPVITVCAKSDQSTDVDAVHYMSETDKESMVRVLNAAVEAIGYEPELPFER